MQKGFSTEIDIFLPWLQLPSKTPVSMPPLEKHRCKGFVLPIAQFSLRHPSLGPYSILHHGHVLWLDLHGYGQSWHENDLNNHGCYTRGYKFEHARNDTANGRTQREIILQDFHALELVHGRCLFPHAELAHHVERDVRRLLHRRHLPCGSSRVSSSCTARVRKIYQSPRCEVVCAPITHAAAVEFGYYHQQC